MSKDEAPRTLGERLRAARRAERYSQAAAATAIGVFQTRISAWERGEGEPKASQIAALARLYKVALAELVEGTRATGTGG